MNKSYYILAVGLLVVLIVGWKYFSSQVPLPRTFDDFAKCLNKNGAVMYGAYWCPHCQNQKNLFGESFQYVNYVECAKEPQICTKAGVEAFPTWSFANGKKLIGEQSLQDLAKASGCALTYQQFVTSTNSQSQ